MGFLQPLLLWGAVAISIPILIHLYHRRRGKIIQWAAMRWLMDKEDQPKKGFKPDHLLLLFLRILIILLIVFFLSRPYLNDLSDDAATETIHLVEPDQALVNEFRFELEQAISGGEELYWLNNELLPITSLEEVPQKQSGYDKALVEALNLKVQPQHELHLYLSPISSYMKPPFLLTPVLPAIHRSEYTPIPASDKYIEAGDAGFLFINQQGMLEHSQTPPAGKKVIDHSGPITYSIALENEEEVNNINAALQAIRDVYGINLEKVNDDADLVFMDELASNLGSEQLLIISNYIGTSEHKNVMIEHQPFTKDESDIVASGRLPEYIFDKILRQYQITPEVKRVSRQQLERQFILDTDSETTRTGNVNEIILLLLLLTVIGERIIAIRKGL